MKTKHQAIAVHPQGEQPSVEVGSAIADTFAGRVHIEWDATAPVTALGQLPFFNDYLKQADLFDACLANCPLSLISPNAPQKRDVLGTVLLSVSIGTPYWHPKRTPFVATYAEPWMFLCAANRGRFSVPA
jgi:hypothetical protein